MKPIVPKKNITSSNTPDSLEASFQKAFVTTAEPQTDQVVSEPAPEIVEKPVRKTKIESKIKENTEGVSRGNRQGVVPPKKMEKNNIVVTKREGVNRVTLDIPNDIFEKIEKHKVDTGQTMKFMMVSLLKKFFAENTEGGA